MADDVYSRVPQLGDQWPVMVAARDVASLVERPERLREEAVIEVELVVDNRPLFRIDVSDLVQRDRVGAVATVLRDEFFRRRDKAVAVLRRREPIGYPFVAGRKLSQTGGRLAGGKIRDRIIAFDGYTLFGVHRRDRRVSQCSSGYEPRQHADGDQ